MKHTFYFLVLNFKWLIRASPHYIFFSNVRFLFVVPPFPMFVALPFPHFYLKVDQRAKYIFASPLWLWSLNWQQDTVSQLWPVPQNLKKPEVSWEPIMIFHALTTFSLQKWPSFAFSIIHFTKTISKFHPRSVISNSFFAWKWMLSRESWKYQSCI